MTPWKKKKRLKKIVKTLPIERIVVEATQNEHKRRIQSKMQIYDYLYDNSGVILGYTFTAENLIIKVSGKYFSEFPLEILS